MEKHFQMAVYLMLAFFCIDFAAEALVAFHVVALKIGGGAAHDAYLAFFGVAMGIFRGMPPDGGAKP